MLILGRLAGSMLEGTLQKSWQAYNEAVEAAMRSDATRVIELQAENEALKTAMRNFKNRAVAMRATQSKTEPPGGRSNHATALCMVFALACAGTVPAACCAI